MCKRALLLFSFACSGGSSHDVPDAAPLDAAVFVGDVAFHVTHYDYQIDFDTRRAKATLAMAVDHAGDCFHVGFRAEDPSDVTLDGVPARDVHVDHDSGVLIACDAQGVGFAAGRDVSLSVSATVPLTKLSTMLDVGFSVIEDDLGNSVTYLLGWLGECDRFGPCQAQPGLFSTYRFTVVHAKGMTVLCPGVITVGDTQTICEFDYAGGPTYSTFSVIANDRFTKVELGDFGGVKATFYDWPHAAGKPSAYENLDVEATSGLLAWMAETFGPYPYGKELRLIAAPTIWAGFEHPGNVTLADNLEPSDLNHTVRHELVHQWAGDQTTPADTYDFVWKEAMAEYLSMVYEDEHLGHNVSAARLEYWKTTAGKYRRYYPVPDERPALATYYGYVYAAGPMVLFRQMESWLGRDGVISALKTVLGRERALSVDDLKQALEAQSGVDLSGYFDHWIYGKGAPAWPTANVVVTPLGDDQHSVRVAVGLTTVDGAPRGCKFTVQLLGGDKIYDVPVDFGFDGHPVEPIDVVPGFDVTGYVVDPYFEALVYRASSSKPHDRELVTNPFLAPPRHH